MRELRHDFRRYYSVRYEDVGVEEAIDLIFMLPCESRYIEKKRPEAAWPRWMHLLADMLDLRVMELRARGFEIPFTARPGDRERADRVQGKARETRKIIESTEWEEV